MGRVSPNLAARLSLDHLTTIKYLLFVALLLTFSTTAFGQQSSVEAQRAKFNGDWIYSDKDNKKTLPGDKGRRITIEYRDPDFKIEESRIVNNKTLTDMRTFFTDGRDESSTESSGVPPREIQPMTRWEEAVLVHTFKMILRQSDPPDPEAEIQMDISQKYKVSDDGELLYVTHDGKIKLHNIPGSGAKGKESGRTIVYRRKP